jgi:hypothetical protein
MLHTNCELSFFSVCRVPPLTSDVCSRVVDDRINVPFAAPPSPGIHLPLPPPLCEMSWRAPQIGSLSISRGREGGKRVVQALPLRAWRHHLRPWHMAARPAAGEGHATLALVASGKNLVSRAWSDSLMRFPGPQVEMLDYRTGRLEMDPVAWNETASSAATRDPTELEFRKIVCEGDFDEGRSVFIGPRSRSISGVTENGFYVITPLIPLTIEPVR